MFFRTKKIIKQLLQRKGKISHFSFSFSPQLQIKFLNKLFIEELDFKLIIIDEKAWDTQLEDIRILDFDFKYSTKNNQHFFPFVAYYDKYKIDGSVVITLNQNEVIIEKRLNTSVTIKATIQTKFKLANQQIFKSANDEVVTIFDNKQAVYSSTFENWVLKNNNELIDLLAIKSNKKYMKNWKATYNNKNYHSIKISIGAQDEKI